MAVVGVPDAGTFVMRVGVEAGGRWGVDLSFDASWADEAAAG